MKKVSIILFVILICTFFCACNENSFPNTIIEDYQKELSKDSESLITQSVFSTEDSKASVESNDKTPETERTTDAHTTETEETMQETVVATEEPYYVSHTFVNFRKEPSTNAELIEKLKNGTRVIKLEDLGEWIFVQHEETKGYVHRDYLSKFPTPNAIEGSSRIIVKKSERLLELWKGETLIHAFPIGLGWEPKGHKQAEGDGKTPEGEYYVCTINRNSAYYLSLGLSYPNKDDALRAMQNGLISSSSYNRIANAIDNGRKPDWNTALGGEIMIHGCGSSSDWTAGCVAVENDVMDLLFDYCPIRTKVTILP